MASCSDGDPPPRRRDRAEHHFVHHLSWIARELLLLPDVVVNAPLPIPLAWHSSTMPVAGTTPGDTVAACDMASRAPSLRARGFFGRSADASDRTVHGRARASGGRHRERETLRRRVAWSRAQYGAAPGLRTPARGAGRSVVVNASAFDGGRRADTGPAAGRRRDRRRQACSLADGNDVATSAGAQALVDASIERTGSSMSWLPTPASPVAGLPEAAPQLATTSRARRRLVQHVLAPRGRTGPTGATPVVNTRPPGLRPADHLSYATAKGGFIGSPSAWRRPARPRLNLNVIAPAARRDGGSGDDERFPMDRTRAPMSAPRPRDCPSP